MKLVISRYWHNPIITVKLSDDDIKIEITSADFVRALAKEIGNPAFILTNAQLERYMLASMINVQLKIQESSTQGVL